jgi:putative nucleotidyltransferase with HDIG domain
MLNGSAVSLQSPQPQIFVSEIISGLAYALDLSQGQAGGHAVRSCIFGMRIAREIGLPTAMQADLYYALLLKDAGCSSCASKMYSLMGTNDLEAKRDIRLTDWTRMGWDSLQYAITHVHTHAPFVERVRRLFQAAVTQKQSRKTLIQIRCDRGAQIARMLGFGQEVSDTIYAGDELWNGEGFPRGLRGQEIPITSRVLNLAQSFEVFWRMRGPSAAEAMIRQRNGRWFDPDLVRALQSAMKRESFWSGLSAEECQTTVVSLEPQERVLPLDEARLDSICLGLADMIDAKTPFTYRHSSGVADTALRIAETLSLDPDQKRFLRRAALLHDVGKLCVPNTILEKPGKLTAEEWEVVKQHPARTLEILERVPGFSELSQVAAAHHEKLDGSGYFRGWTAEQLSLEARILVVADIFDALAARRPYRDALPTEQVLLMMQADAPKRLDADCVAALHAAKHGRDHSSDVAHFTDSLRQLSELLASQSEKTPTSAKI